MGKTSGHPEAEQTEAERSQGSRVEFGAKNNTTSAPVKYKLADEDLDKLVVETSRQVSRLAGETHDVELSPVDPQLSDTRSGEQPNRLLSDDRSISSQPKRPMNAFMVWGQAIRRYLHNRFSNVQNALLSKALGRTWKILDAKEKEPFVRKANLIKANHKRDYPNYRYQPRRFHERRARSSMLIGINLNHPINQQLRASTSGPTIQHMPSESAQTSHVVPDYGQVSGLTKQNSNQLTSIDGRPYRYSSHPDQSECHSFDNQMHPNSMQSIGYQLNITPLRETEHRSVSYHNPTTPATGALNHHDDTGLAYQDHLQCTMADKPVIEYAFTQNQQHMSAYNLVQHNYQHHHLHHHQSQQQHGHNHHTHHHHHPHHQQQTAHLMLSYELPQQQSSELIVRNTAASYAASTDTSCHMSSVHPALDNSLLSEQSRYSQIFRPHGSNNNQPLGFNNKF